jgi:hypothetical protein
VTSLALDVPVRGDALNEDDESFFVDLSDAAEAGLARAQGQATILNDDPLPTLSVGDLRVKEGGLPATFTVSLSAASARTVTVDYATSDGSATAGSDYQAVSGTLTFPPGLRTRKVSVPLLDDAWVEGTEGFLLKLAGPVLASLGRAHAMAMVVDDDRRPRAFRP